jgi:hypothetical protein
MQLADLTDDALTSILSTCIAPSVTRVAQTCTLLRTAAGAPTVWQALLRRDWDVEGDATLVREHTSAGTLFVSEAMRLFRRLHTSRPIALACTGLFTDGGVDASANPLAAAAFAGAPDDVQECEVERRMWVSSAFDPEARLYYCSETSHEPTHLGAAITGGDPGAAEREEAEAEEREWLIGRLSFVAGQFWGWAADGFGGMRACGMHELCRALRTVWELPPPQRDQLLLQAHRGKHSIAPPGSIAAWHRTAAHRGMSLQGTRPGGRAAALARLGGLAQRDADRSATLGTAAFRLGGRHLLVDASTPALSPFGAAARGSELAEGAQARSIRKGPPRAEPRVAWRGIASRSIACTG